MIMKTLKYTLSALVAVLLCVCVVSCGEDYSSPLKGQTVSDQTFETGTNSKTVTIGTKDLSKCKNPYFLIYVWKQHTWSVQTKLKKHKKQINYPLSKDIPTKSRNFAHDIGVLWE